VTTKVLSEIADSKKNISRVINSKTQAKAIAYMLIAWRRKRD